MFHAQGPAVFAGLRAFGWEHGAGHGMAMPTAGPAGILAQMTFVRGNLLC